MEQTYTVTHADGSKETVTVAQFKAFVKRRSAEAAKISAAWRSGDIEATAKAQADYRAHCHANPNIVI